MSSVFFQWLHIALLVFAAATMSVNHALAQAKTLSTEEVSRLKKDLANPHWQVATIEELSKLGPAARDFVPDLIRITQDTANYAEEGQPSEAVCKAGLAVGKIASPKLILDSLEKLRTMGRDQPQRSSWWTFIRELYRPGDAEIDAALCKVVKTPRDVRRAEVADFVGQRGHHLKVLIPDLTEMLKSELYEDRAAALFSLRYFGPEAVAATPFVDRIYRDKLNEEQQLRASAFITLAAINRENEGILRNLRTIANDSDQPEVFRCVAVDGIGKNTFGDSAIDDLIRIAAAMEANNESGIHALAMHSFIAISNLHPKKRHLPELLKVAKRIDDGDPILPDAIGAIGKIGPDAKEAVPLLLKFAGGPHFTCTGAMEDALKKILGPKAGAAELRQLLKSLDRPAPLLEIMIRNLESANK